MTEGMARVSREGELGVEQQVADLEYQDLLRRLGVQSEAGATVRSGAQQSAATSAEEWWRMMQALASYLQLGKGQVVGKQSSGGGGGIWDILGKLGKAWVGRQTGLPL